MSKRKYTAYSLELKLQVLKEADEKKLTETEICRKHGIQNFTLSTILGSRQKIEKAKGESIFLPNTKKINNATQVWFKQARTLNVLVLGPILIEKALKISKSMGLHFTPNGGWLERVIFCFIF